jgi:hypothetical protein
MNFYGIPWFMDVYGRYICSDGEYKATKQN